MHPPTTALGLGPLHDTALAVLRGSFVLRDDDLPEGSVSSSFGFHDHFVWEQKIGQGSFADVWVVRHSKRQQEQFAIKVYKGEVPRGPRESPSLIPASPSLCSVRCSRPCHATVPVEE